MTSQDQKITRSQEKTDSVIEGVKVLGTFYGIVGALSAAIFGGAAALDGGTEELSSVSINSPERSKSLLEAKIQILASLIDLSPDQSKSEIISNFVKYFDLESDQELLKLIFVGRVDLSGITIGEIVNKLPDNARKTLFESINSACNLINELGPSNFQGDAARLADHLLVDGYGLHRFKISTPSSISYSYSEFNMTLEMLPDGISARQIYLPFTPAQGIRTIEAVSESPF